MQITDLLKSQSIQLNADPATKIDAIYILGDLMEKGGHLADKDTYLQAVFERENSGSTGLGEGIATPHAKSSGVKDAGLSAMVVPGGVDFDSLDGNPARLFFMIAAPEGAANTHVEVLSKLATMIIDPDFKEALIAADSTERFLALIDAKENDKFDVTVPGFIKTEDTLTDVANDMSANATTVAATAATATAETTGANEEKPSARKVKGQYDVLAVTACPTGIAHTYMAAESLERKAKEMGISLKVEKNGAAGIKDALTPEEISNAKCIIIAADKQVAMARFNGKQLIQTKVANGINKSEELLTQAMSGDNPVYQAIADDTAQVEDSANDSIGRQIYKHLMNGVSHMLPFVIGGGILIALAFLFDTFDPTNPSGFGSGTPLAAFLMKVGGTSFGFMLPVLAGYIAMSIADRPGLAAGFVGGMLANQGGSGFLGALIAGFVAGYLVLGIKKLVSGLPDSLEGTKPVLFYPVLGVLFIGIAITFIINPPVSALNNWLMESLQTMGTSSRVLLGLIFGAMMSVDMGGPVNKAAYVIGTGALATGEYGIMASVMAGGMVPPLAIALCTTLFPNRFSEAERKSGPTNYIMGLSFITEGAIPFAAADPIRVLPSCIIGAGTAGALSMFFECTLRAPHGGIFVVPTIGNPLMYLVSIAIGAVIGCALLAILKNPVKA
ncbi:MAG: PTS sugar transporter subunit IIA [Veillonella sp.]|jgi:PTS system fructose-specific IIC component|uniref:PTS fructose transporter subunit IIABC n=1 Tax=Veillonella sp. TaxID=1926307 RepID=UPI001B672DCB|nr:fructose-specific PTS transporter subunit EIIC [Veillonella sp.]NCB95329.1 PTS fructose transporter subunit IIC [Negativicutes bacterium]MBP6922303.1 PTS sugar transporter subunit IIA [Veillonella sp.]MBP8616744.1 PTS sugar transporter subunit IIA [Veillonella sp.]MBP9517410.1 PTS sugar transporter subunit IIA [Veillonella sp.]MBP9551314.1 PTS sugar transporter subunit IIA [Veillonella sp.]